MKKKMFGVLFLGCSVVLLGACSSSQQAVETSTTKSTATHAQKTEHIDYDDQKSWAFSSGNMQSPINIVSKDAKPMTPDKGEIQLNYGKEITKVENNGHSIQVTDGGTSVINGRNFELSQFHFHAESEHTLDGKHFPMEAHFVNTAEDGRVAVIGVFFKEGKTNKGFQEVLDDVKEEKTDPITDVDEMLPETFNYYHYLGSLTTPPLNENVEWYVMKNPVAVSPEQIKTFKKLYSHNNREVQPLNDRVVLEHNE